MTLRLELGSEQNLMKTDFFLKSFVYFRSKKCGFFIVVARNIVIWKGPVMGPRPIPSSIV